MQARYGGHKFDRAFKSGEQLDQTKREWAGEFERRDDQMILQAIKMMPNHYVDWPPNLNEFLVLCRQTRRAEELRQPEKLLCNSTQAQRDAWAEIHLTAIKAMLHRKEKTDDDETVKGHVQAKEKRAKGSRSGTLSGDCVSAEAEPGNQDRS